MQSCSEGIYRINTIRGLTWGIVLVSFRLMCELETKLLSYVHTEVIQRHAQKQNFKVKGEVPVYEAGQVGTVCTDASKTLTSQAKIIIIETHQA